MCLAADRRPDRDNLGIHPGGSLVSSKSLGFGGYHDENTSRLRQPRRPGDRGNQERKVVRIIVYPDSAAVY
jgi:hypothetical protein